MAQILQYPLKITEKPCKTAISKTGIQEYDFVINPYIGCQHACVYCYANFMRRFSGHLQDRWGTFVDVKVNLLEVLRAELAKRKKGGVIWLSSICDPYQPIEQRYQLTRGIIRLVSEHPEFSISILTKSTMVLQDLELLQNMRERLEVGFTITTFSREAQRHFEPYASPVDERLKALKTLHDAGVNTWAFIAPMLPYATEEGLEMGLQCLAECKVRRLLTDRYNARGMVIGQTLDAYHRWRPDLTQQALRDLLWKHDEYYRELDEKIQGTWASLQSP